MTEFAEDKKLSIDSLGDLDDGIVREIVNAAIAECLEDCDNRAMLNKTRKVTMTVHFDPVVGKHGELKGIHTAVEVKHAIPPRAANVDYCATTIRGSDVEAYLPDSRQDTMFPPEPRNAEEIS